MIIHFNPMRSDAIRFDAVMQMSDIIYDNSTVCCRSVKPNAFFSKYTDIFRSPNSTYSHFISISRFLCVSVSVYGKTCIHFSQAEPSFNPLLTACSAHSGKNFTKTFSMQNYCSHVRFKLSDY